MAAQRYRTDRPIGPLALDHVQVAAPAGCEAAARAFYGELLGLPELPKPAALHGRGGTWFALDGEQALHVGVLPEGFAPADKAHPALRARDAATLRGLADRLMAAGAVVRWDEPLPGVGARFFTADPWGNRLELLASRSPSGGSGEGPRSWILRAVEGLSRAASVTVRLRG